MAVKGNTIHYADSRAIGDFLGKKDRIDCILTDPPYGMDVQMNSASTPKGKKKNKKIANDGDLDTALGLFAECMEAAMPYTGDELEMYVFTAWHITDHWKRHLEELGRVYDFKVKMKLIWDKGYPGKGDLEGNWGCGYEEIYYCKRGRRKLPKRRSGIIHVDKVPSGQNVHPTEKPVDLLVPLIEMSTDPDALVVDFFSGSGSTSVAAQRCRRRSLAFDIDPGYVEVGTERLTQIGFGF